MSLKSVFLVREGFGTYKGKEPILISVEEFKALYAVRKIHGAYLSEIGRKQLYWIDVPKGHPQYHRPYVKTTEPWP